MSYVVEGEKWVEIDWEGSSRGLVKAQSERLSRELKETTKYLGIAEIWTEHLLHT
jgi:hypothetical protein